MVALQCVASMAGTLIGESLGETVTAKLVGGVLGALVGAFLTAPGRHRRRRIVAVVLAVLLLDALRRAAGALAAGRERQPQAWVPANWAVVGLTAVAGFAAGSAVTTVRGGWDEERVTVVSVPQVRAETSDAALALLDDAGLRVSSTTEPSESIATGFATRTSPAAGSRVEPRAEVMLFISSGRPRATITVPDVTGQRESAAFDLLQDSGLRVQSEHESSASIADGHATRTNPPAGTQVRRGATVVLFASSGPAVQPVRVPEVRGRPRSTALELVRDAGLRSRASSEASGEIARGSATRSDPPAGTEVDRGAVVTVFVSSGPPRETVPVPDVAGDTREAAFAAIEVVQLRPAGVTEASGSVAAGTVIRTDPIAGSLVAVDSEVKVIVSSGPPPPVVPDVVGLDDDVAARRVVQEGLDPDIVNAGSEDLPLGVIIRTEPPAGAVVKPGSTVTLHASCGSPSCVD